MNEDTVNRTNDVLHALDDRAIQRSVDEALTKDPMRVLREEILGFFRSHIKLIGQQERLRSKIQEALEVMVEGGELEFNQLIQAYNTVSNKEIASADAIISIFKPVPGATSILAATVGENEKKNDEYQNMHDSLPAEQLQALEKLWQAVQKVAQDGNLSEK